VFAISTVSRRSTQADLVCVTFVGAPRDAIASALELGPLDIGVGPFDGAPRVRDRRVCGLNAGIGGFDLRLRRADISPACTLRASCNSFWR
jgi:hypothetical protein